MDWRKRLVGIAVAGGTVAVSAAGCTFGGGACNANPDPCCTLPEGSVCQPKIDCEKKGGTYVQGDCILEAGPDADAEADATPDASGDGGDASADGSDGGDAADQ